MAANKKDMATTKSQEVMIREYFTERGPYRVVHVSEKGNVTFEKEDGECYFRNKREGVRFL